MMTRDLLTAVFAFYDRELCRLGIVPDELAEAYVDLRTVPRDVLIAHCAWAVRSSLSALKDPLRTHGFDIMPFIHSLGYVQGVFHVHGVWTLRDCRVHIGLAPDPAAPPVKMSRYEKLEREHLGDPDKKTGIYHPDVTARTDPDGEVD